MSGRRSRSADGNQSGRNRGRQRLIGKCGAAGDRPGRASDQKVDAILLRHDLLLEQRDGRRLIREQGLGPRRLDGGRGAALQLPIEEVIRFLERRLRAAGDVELRIELSQIEVRSRHFRRQRKQHSSTSFLGREIRRTSGFVQAADAPPQVGFPGDDSARDDDFVRLSVCVLPRRAHFVADRRISLRLRDAEPRARLLDSRRGDAGVVAVAQRFVDERPQHGIAEDVEPRRIGERRRFSGSVRPVELIWNRHRRPAIVRTDGASGENHSGDERRSRAFHAWASSASGVASTTRCSGFFSARAILSTST